MLKSRIFSYVCLWSLFWHYLSTFSRFQLELLGCCSANSHRKKTKKNSLGILFGFLALRIRSISGANSQSKILDERAGTAERGKSFFTFFGANSQSTWESANSHRVFCRCEFGKFAVRIRTAHFSGANSQFINRAATRMRISENAPENVGVIIHNFSRFWP